MPGGLVAVSGALGRAAVPNDVVGDAVLDDGDALLRNPLQVEGLRHALRVVAVVEQREALMEELLAQATAQVAATLEVGERPERAETEVPKELGEGIGLENRGVGAGLDLGCAARPFGLLGGLAR